FESVLAARAGRSPDEQRAFVGELLAPFSKVASNSPYAWFRESLSADDIAVPRPGNRLVAEPYTKKMTAFLGGAQGAALLVTSLGFARRHRLAESPMFVWGAASANEVVSLAARRDLGRCEALEIAASAALAQAGTGVDEMGHLDVYSCFPSAVQIGASALGVGGGDPRGLTLTGGLPYFGGPGSNYVTHSIATLFERLRDQGGHGADASGLVTGVSWYLTRSSVGIYGAGPPPSGSYRPADSAALVRLQRRIDADALQTLSSPERPVEAVVEASTVVYDRMGTARSAPVVATLPDGSRVAAAASEGEAVQVAGRFLPGQRVVIYPAAAGVPPGSPPTYRLAGGS
ncbi:MAG: acetyl-CoA acetyltransferase, partial [Acidimicrobiales bacterium]